MPGGGALKGGGEGGNQGIEKGNDAPDGHTLEEGGLNNGPDQPAKVYRVHLKIVALRASKGNPSLL